MNTRNPLTVALLLIASPALAQFPGAAGATAAGPLSGASASAYNFSLPAGPVDDTVFKCNTPPYIACTDVHMNKREAIRIAGRCPEPASAACVEFLMKDSGSSNPAETIAAFTPPPGAQWASPTCQHIPCRTVGSPTGAGATESGLPYDQQPGFIGPPAPPKNQGPQPFADESSFKQAMQDQESLTPGKVIDLGNNTYAVDTGDGNYSIGGLCSGAPCNGMPKPADQIPGLADKIQESRSLNSGNQALNGDNPGGFSPMSNKSAPQTPNLANSGRTTGAPSPVAASASDEARANGGDAGDFIRSSFADSGSGDTGSFASNGSYAPAGDESKPIPVSQAEVDAQVRLGSTFNVNINMETNVIPGVAANADALLRDGASKTERVNVDSTIDANTHNADPKVDPNQ